MSEGSERAGADAAVIRVLDADGRVREDASVPPIDDDELVGMYREMRLARRFDERAISLQRQGRSGTYPSLAGQEGSQIGGVHALADRDLLAFQYREHGMVISRALANGGAELLGDYLAYWMGHEAGNAALGRADVFPLNICIGSQLPHAAGLAWAADYRGDDRVVACHFGDGATSEGDFHEGLNFAGVFDAPAVFVCNNNQWAISVPSDRQTASETFAGKAEAYGIEGVRVDGTDPLATYAVTRAAVRKARNPDEGESRPTLVETVQYRFGAHTTADDPSAYRDEAEVERWKQLDPIPRFERFLRERGLLDDERIDAIATENEQLLADAIDRAESYEGDPEEMFTAAYAEPTPRLHRQRAELRALRERHGDDPLFEDQ